MECPECKMVEMRVEKVEDGFIHYVCRKCGEEVIKSIEEVENEGE